MTPSSGGSGGKEFQDFVANALLLVDLELRAHWQGEDFRGDPLGYREVTCLEAEVLVRLLEVKRDGIVNSRANPSLSEMLLKLVAIPNPDHVEMVNWFRPGRLVGELYFRLG
jgi:hypothetical protein